MIHVRIWLVSSAPESVEGRVWTAHTTITSRGCQHFPSLGVGDSDAVSLRCAWTRDQMMSFCYHVFSWLLHVHSWTSAHLKPWTAQDVITPCSSHSCFTDPKGWAPTFRATTLWTPTLWAPFFFLHDFFFKRFCFFFFCLIFLVCTDVFRLFFS